MGVRTYETTPDRTPRRPGPDPGATFLVGGLAVALLLANGRPIGAPQSEGAAGALLQVVVAALSVGRTQAYSAFIEPKYCLRH